MRGISLIWPPQRTCFLYSFSFVFFSLSSIPHNLLPAREFLSRSGWVIFQSSLLIDLIFRWWCYVVFFALSRHFSQPFTIPFLLQFFFLLPRKWPGRKRLSKPNHNFKRFSDEEKQRFCIHLIIMMSHFLRWFFLCENLLLFFCFVLFVSISVKREEISIFFFSFFMNGNKKIWSRTRG